MIGETIEGFEVVGVLGQGPAGDLYLAQEPVAKKEVAIRIWPVERSSDAAAVQRCLADARASSSVGHPGIARVLHTGTHAGRAFVVSEWVAGDTLEARIAKAGRLAAPAISDLGKRVADALAAAHAKGLLHRDLRPSRIMVIAEAGGFDTIRIFDFGCAALEPTPTTVEAATYAAPERWTSPGNVDPRADTYALGCMAFEMATGRPPFQGTLDEVRARHLSEPPPQARSVMPDLPPGLEHLIAKMMQKQPADRPKAIAEVARAFEVLGGGALATSGTATTEAFQEALAPVVAYGTTANDPPATPSELFTRAGEIGNAAVMPAPRAPTTPSIVAAPELGAVVVTSPAALSALSSPALRAADQGAGATMSVRAAKSGPSMTLILIIGAIAAAAVVAVIMFAMK